VRGSSQAAVRAGAVTADVWTTHTPGHTPLRVAVSFVRPLSSWSYYTLVYTLINNKLHISRLNSVGTAAERLDLILVLLLAEYRRQSVQKWPDILITEIHVLVAYFVIPKTVNEPKSCVSYFYR